MFQLKNKFSLITVITFLLTVFGGCASTNNTNNSSSHKKIQFSSQVSFGDSLSDVGSYAVGLIASSGGGRYTVNATLPTGLPAPTNWTELLASTLQVSAPCSAETGLNGSAQQGLSVPIVYHTPACTNYAQGGAMITYPYGPGNASVAPFPNGNPVNGSTTLGQLTVPIVTQIQNHLNAHGGAFSGSEIVTLLAGGNDALVNTLIYLGKVQAAAASGGTTAAEAAAAVAGPVAIQAMQNAGSQLVTYVNHMILGKGAKYVMVLTLPNLSITPFGTQVNAALPGTQALINQMVTAFNNQLTSGLTNPNVLIVDLYPPSMDQITNPAKFGLTNVTDTACNLAPPVNFLDSSLICNAKNAIPGDISHYAFADQFHLTPYGNTLITQYVINQLTQKGWL